MIKDYTLIALSLMITGLVIFSSCAIGCVTGTADHIREDDGSSVDERILMLAQTAASSHNSQPWSLKKSEEGRYTVLVESERWLNRVDPDKRELLLSLGAYLENLRIAAECYGYHADIDVLMKDTDDMDLANFTLLRHSGEMNAARIILMKRSSMAKVKYKKKLKSMKTLFSLLEDQDNLIWIDRSDSAFNSIVEDTVNANSQQAWNDEKQSELADYICFSREDEDSGVGMTPEMLNLPWFMSRSWYKKADRETLMSGMFRNGSASKAKKLMKNSAGMILITSRDNSVQSLLDCGGQFQRLYWEFKEAGIELHTVSQVLEESPWKEALAGNISMKEPVQFVLRAGRTGRAPAAVDTVSSASIRMPRSGFLID